MKLYYKGQELKEDNQELESLTNESNIEIVMLNISLTEDTEANNLKLSNAVVKNLSNFCEIHLTEKTTFLCIGCKCYICDKCEEGYHKGHQIIPKNEINVYEKKLHDIRDDLNGKLKNIGIDCNFQDFYKRFRSDFNKRGEHILEMVENIKKREIIILNKFKSHLDKHFPKVMDFRDNLENLISQIAENNRENLLKNENEFADFYEKYLQFNDIIPKTEENINLLTSKVEKYNIMFDTFKQKTEDILYFMNSNLIYINEIQTTEEKVLEKASNFSPKKGVRKNSLRKSSVVHLQPASGGVSNINQFNSGNKKFNLDNNSNNNYAPNQILNNYDSTTTFQNLELPKELTTKMSILNTLNKANKLLSNSRVQKIKANEQKSIEDSDLSQNINNLNKKLTFKNNDNKIDEEEKNKSQKSNKDKAIQGVSDLNENTTIVIDESDKLVESLVISVIVATKNILIYDNKTKEFTKKEIDLSNLGFKKFEAYHSTLNYNSMFYIAGGYGYANSKNFCVYNPQTNLFTKLSDMMTGHSYNGLIGSNDYIYAISGFKSNKAERYSISNSKAWSKLPNLHLERSWPNCYFIKNNLYVAGGLTEGKETDQNNFIECLDISKNQTWERIDINIGELINIPFNCGLLKLNESEIILIGGRIEKTKDSESSCWALDKDGKTLIQKDDMKLTEPEEFDGKSFIFLGEDNYGQYSSIYYNKFYIFDKKDKTFRVIQYNEEN